MSTPVVTHNIADNMLLICPKQTADDQAAGIIAEPKEHIALGVEQIFVGVENSDTQKEIRTDSETGFNYARTAVEAQEIYNLKKQKHRNWFILDLETGQHGWFPGCVIRGDITKLSVDLKAEPFETSETLYTFTEKTWVTVLEIETPTQEPLNAGWHKVEYITTGYVRTSDINNLRYANPNSTD